MFVLSRVCVCVYYVYIFITLHIVFYSRHLEFPNGVAVNDNQEVFISDNRAHCVKVFDYQGNYLRQIGGEGVSNFPIGVGVTASGDIAIADNHNNFNLTVFNQVNYTHCQKQCYPRFL